MGGVSPILVPIVLFVCGAVTARPNEHFDDLERLLSVVRL